MTINIVCLHGFTQNSEIIKKKLSGLIKSNDKISLHFLEGSVKLPSDQNSIMRAYWTYSIEDPLSANWIDHYNSESVLYNLDESLKSFIELGNKIGGIDGVIGFSQGGCFADYICKLHASNQISFKIKFAIFISAETFNRPGYDFDSIIPTIDTLHIYGMADSIIPPNMSEVLSAMYVNREVLVHKGAHVIPSNSVAKTAVKKLLAKFIN